MKVHIGNAQLYWAFHKARYDLGITDPKTKLEIINAFEKTYDVEFIDNGDYFGGDYIHFKSEADYFAFLLKWS